jgi:hypothetical protein
MNSATWKANWPRLSGGDFIHNKKSSPQINYHHKFQHALAFVIHLPKRPLALASEALACC